MVETITSPTYTQDALVAFTAGTLSTTTDCTAYIEAHLNRGTLSATTTPSTTQVNEEIVRAKEELLEFHPFTFTRRYASCTSTAGAFRYALPADYQGGHISLRDVTNNFMPKYYPPAQYDLKFPDMNEEANGEPNIFTIKGRELWTGPPTSASITLELEYNRSGDDSTATDISYIPEVYRFRMCDRAIANLFRTLHEYEKAMIYDASWEKGVLIGKRSNNRKRWASFGHQGLTWQQEYSARYNQS